MHQLAGHQSNKKAHAYYFAVLTKKVRPRKIKKRSSLVEAATQKYPWVIFKVMTKKWVNRKSLRKEKERERVKERIVISLSVSLTLSLSLFFFCVC